MTTQATAGVDFILPGTWAHIPVDSDDAMGAAIKAIVRQALGGADDRAHLRRELSQLLSQAGLQARQVGGQDFHFAVELVPGGHLPLSLVLSWPILGTSISAAAGAAAAAEAHSARVRRLRPEAEVEVLAGSTEGIVRVVEVRSDREGAATIEDIGKLTVTYWFFGPRPELPLVMTFNSPLFEEKVSIVTLCDAIASSVTWKAVIG